MCVLVEGQTDQGYKIGAKTTTVTITIMQQKLCDVHSCASTLRIKNWKTAKSNSFISHYDGIPQNLVFNVVGCCSFVLLFSLLRKKAWNYGRIAFVEKSKKCTLDDADILYGGITTEVQPADKSRRIVSSDRLSTPVEILIDDHGCFRWILTTFRLTDDQIKAKSGLDAVHYLSFQRHLIFLACIFLIISVTIILPINCQEKSPSKSGVYAYSFVNCTIENLGTRNRLLWVHDSLPLIYLVITVIVLRHFSKTLAIAERDPKISRTIMISRIAKRNSNSTKLEKHFQEIYPDAEIEEISFAYNITALQEAERKMKDAATARKYWENYFDTTGKRPIMYPYRFPCGICCVGTFGKILGCFKKCGFNATDAIEYYMKMEEHYQNFVTLERIKARTRPLGIAFVTFQSFEMAHRAVVDYQSLLHCCKQKPTSTFSRKLRSHHWIVTYAPLPEDLYMGNLSLSYKAWYFKFFLVNIVLIIIVVVYSTPVVILNALNQGLKLTEQFQSQGHSSTFGQTAPTFLLWITAVTLPSLVSVSDGMIGFWTRTAENRSRMIKTFTFLLAMVIILPALGQQSVFNIVNGKSTVSFSCIFYTVNGVFFANYVITSAFLGAASELMRFSELFCYALRLCFAKSAAEIDSVRKSVLWDFGFGSQYAWVMLNFTMFVIFSFIFPVITPFGLMYLFMKHYVDRYNIYFAYAPCEIDKEVHVTAVNFVFCTMFLLQITMLIYTNVAQDRSKEFLKVATVISFCFTAAFFFSQLFFNMCTSLSPYTYTNQKSKSHGIVRDTTVSVDMESVDVDNLDADITDVQSVASHRKEVEQTGRYYPEILRNQLV